MAISKLDKAMDFYYLHGVATYMQNLLLSKVTVLCISFATPNILSYQHQNAVNYLVYQQKVSPTLQFTEALNIITACKIMHCDNKCCN